jgi:hypothetical protein
MAFLFLWAQDGQKFQPHLWMGFPGLGYARNGLAGPPDQWYGQ